MKKNILFAAVMGAVLLTACQTVEPEKVEEGGLSINILSNYLTKASTEAQAWESSLNKMRVLVYNSEGKIYKDELLQSPFTSATIPNVKVGTYSVYAVANNCAGISDVSTLSSLNASTVKLDDCSKTTSTGFVMFGGKLDVSVTAGTTPTPVTASMAIAGSSVTIATRKTMKATNTPEENSLVPRLKRFSRYSYALVRFIRRKTGM